MLLYFAKRKLLLIFMQYMMLNKNFAFAKNYLKGQNATLTCSVDSISGRSSNTFSPAYMWFIKRPGGKDIPVVTYVSEVLTISESSPLYGRAQFDPPVLYIRDLVVTDSATYRCQVAGPSVETSSTVLEVNAVPTVSVDVNAFPTVDKHTGLYAAALCQAASGKPQAKIRWIQTETRETQASDETKEMLPDGTFTVKSTLRLAPGLIGRLPNSTDPVTTDDTSRNFACVVSHEYFEAGLDKEVVVAVNLLHAPVVTISFISNKLTCNAAGNPVPTIIWTRPDGSKEIGTLSIFVDQTTPRRSSGRYVCLAKSSVGPEAVAAIDVKESKDLPTLFTSTLLYNASIPVKAQGYEMECTAELESLKNVAILKMFIWTKDGKVIKENLSPYSIRESAVKVSKEKSLVTSVLRIIEVQRTRDEGLFKCRLYMPAIGTGYVSAIERRIHITVDYPPSRESVRTTILPHSTMTEFSDVKLSCYATSSPPSSYRWFFNGNPKSSGSQLVLRNVSRVEAGLYKCMAFNYVPGSATKEVRLAVNYPPGKVTITRAIFGKFLSCRTEGGSVPPPYYTWLLPNNTITDGNTSTLEIPTFDVSVPTSYTCLVGNGLDKTTNSTFQIARISAAARIGSLTIGEFIVAVIVSLLLLIIVVVFVVWIFKKREWKTSGGINKNQEYDASAPVQNGQNTSMSPKIEGKPSLVNYVHLNSKSNLTIQKENADKDQSKYKSVEMLDGSGVEIIENASMRSAATENDRPLHGNAFANSPVRMTTFSQPPSGFVERPMHGKNYNTARHPPRERYADMGMTRALSENFHPVLFDDTAGRNKHYTGSESPNGKDDSAETTDSILPPAYSVVQGRGGMSPRPTMSTPIPTGQLVNGRQVEMDKDYTSDSSSGTSARRVSSDQSEPVEAGTPNSHITNTAANLYPSYRYNAVSHEPYGAYQPEGGFRSPVPSRCRSVDPAYAHECTPPMADLPTRNYLYHPYVEARLGIPLSVQPPVATVGSPYDSGSDSAKSSNVTSVTSSGRRMQSLTLV